MAYHFHKKLLTFLFGKRKGKQKKSPGAPNGAVGW
jgi:hypothetical protein